jgi:hypothetical protein
MRAVHRRWCWMIVAGALSCAIAASGICAERVTVETRAFHIGSKALASALHEFSTQANADVISSSELIEGKSSTQVIGTMTPAAALQALLSGTGLEIVERQDGSFVLIQPRKNFVEPHRRGSEHLNL